MQDIANLTNKVHSEKAKEILCHNAELCTNRRLKQSKLLTLRDGKEVIQIFDPEQIESEEMDYDGNTDLKQKLDYRNIRQPNLLPFSITIHNDTLMTMTGYMVSLLSLSERGLSCKH